MSTQQSFELQSLEELKKSSRDSVMQRGTFPKFAKKRKVHLTEHLHSIMKRYYSKGQPQGKLSIK